MIDFLKSMVWFCVSTRLCLSVDESKIVIYDLEKRFLNDSHFDLSKLDGRTMHAFEFYLETKKNLDCEI